MSRAVLILAFWTFLAMPSMCQAGLLVHACDEHDSGGCGHEGDCSDDPCAKSISVSVQRTDAIDSMPQPVAMLPIQDQVRLNLSTQGPGASPRLTLKNHLATGMCLPLLI